MACNCATNEQIEALYREFGHKVDVPKGATFKFRLKNALTKVGVGISIAFLLPYLFFYVIKEGVFGDGKISLAEFFGFRKKIVKKDVGKQ